MTIKSAIVSWDTELLKEIFSNENTWFLYRNMYYRSWIQDFRKIKKLPQRRQRNRRLEGIEPRTYNTSTSGNTTKYLNKQSCYLPEIKQKCCKQFVIHLLTEFCNYGTSIIFVNNAFLFIYFCCCVFYSLKKF